MGTYRRKYGTNELPRIDLRQRSLWSPTTVALTVDGVQIPLVFTPCRFGGRRPWMVCGGCGGHRIVLYRYPRTQRWRCRRCLGLTYPSQRASRDVARTAQLRLEALCQRFDPEWRYVDDYPRRPAGVHRRTWARFLKAVQMWESRLDEDFMLGVVRLMDTAQIRSALAKRAPESRQQRRMRGRP